MDWTTEQILGLAPDQFTLRASRGIAQPNKWRGLHQDGATLWGSFPNGSQKTGETAVFLPSLSLTCTCNSRKFPCRHSIGLLLLWQQQGKRFTPHPPLRHLAAWVKREKVRHNRSIQPNNLYRLHQPSRQRLKQLKIGLHELELWLTDLVRHGLASLPERPKIYWETMAHRLVDAQANTLAQELRSMANVPIAQPNWPEEYLKRIGRLYLIIQGFHNYEQLPATTQADLQTAVGWLSHDLKESTITTDNWLVLGRHQEKFGRQSRNITWLWGQEIQKITQLTDLGQTTKPQGLCLATNSIWHGRLRFSPSNWPLMAVRYGGLHRQNSAIQPRGFGNIRQATQAYSQAMTANPWLTDFPMLLHNIRPSQHESGWQIVDQVGTILPLPEKFIHGWHLMAMAGAASALTLFGFWNGRFLKPLSVQNNLVWQDIHIWRGVK